MTIRTSRVHPTVAIVAAALTLGTATACGTDSTAASESTVTVSNCGADVAYPQPLDRLFVNDGGMIAIALAAGPLYGLSERAAQDVLEPARYVTAVMGP